MKREPTKSPTTMKFVPGKNMVPQGAATYTGGGNRPAHPKLNAMPPDPAKVMPTRQMFPRLTAMGSSLSPNPAERIEGRAYPGPGRMVGNFSDRSTPHGILRVRTVNEDPTKGA